MADTSMADEFGYPLRAAERLHAMQGGRITEGDHALGRDLPGRRGIDIDVPGDLGFTAREYLDAQFELYCFNIKNGLPNALP